MNEQITCRDCQQWPRGNGAKGAWRKCRKWYRLMREDWSCKEGQPLSQPAADSSPYTGEPGGGGT